jgi:hypothetical protein
MKLSLAAEAKLKAWYQVSTWHTSHIADMNRWYDFVNQYQLDYGFSVDEVDLREHIEYKIRELGNPMGEQLSELLLERIGLMCNILDFLEQTGR